MERLPTDENSRAMVISCLIDEVRCRIEASEMPQKPAAVGLLGLLSDIVFDLDEEVSSTTVRELLPAIDEGLSYHLDLPAHGYGDEDTPVQFSPDGGQTLDRHF